MVWHGYDSRRAEINRVDQRYVYYCNWKCQESIIPCYADASANANATAIQLVVSTLPSTELYHLPKWSHSRSQSCRDEEEEEGKEGQG